MKKIFIDGSAGTTGLRIHERLAGRNDIEMILLSEADRKNEESRKKALNECDIAFLCLPDVAAIEAVSFIENPDTVVIDTSTAHRTDDQWMYGYPELSAKFENGIKYSKRIAVPGCHASGFITLVYPLIEAGLISKDVKLTCHTITGYSGGGKKMIAEYEDSNRSSLLDAPRQYGLSQQHKHLKEMKIITGLNVAPVFCPIVCDFYSGMVATVPLFREDLQNGASAQDIKKIFENKYSGPVVRYIENIDEDGFVSASALTGKDSMQVTVAGNDERILLIARFDNLGKGASGAAVECLNIVLGTDKTLGLDL